MGMPGPMGPQGPPGPPVSDNQSDVNNFL
jgi:hypothetical protein